jgi:hypothetical protein
VQAPAKKTRIGRGRAKKTLDFIAAIIKIAAIYQPFSVRALEYQMFNRKLIPSMSTNDTKRVSKFCKIAREEGDLPWEWIVDDTRREQGVATWKDLMAYAKVVQASYRRNKWLDQPTYVCVWSEKGTIQGTLAPVLDKYEVRFQVTHGWTGATTVWNAAEANLRRDQKTLILYVGDYDPSGMFMSERDLPQRLARYSSNDPSKKDIDPVEVQRMLAEANIEIRRIALTTADTRALGTATRFPAADKKGDEEKKGDSRYEWFVENYGDWCWELDALDPNTLRERVENAILAEMDTEAWDRYAELEEAEMETIAETCAKWPSI